MLPIEILEMLESPKNTTEKFGVQVHETGPIYLIQSGIVLQL